MSQSTPAFNCDFPYSLSEDEALKLDYVRSTLTVLCDVFGMASVKNKNGTPECTVKSLHEMLWGLSTELDNIVLGYESRMSRPVIN